MWLRLEVCPFDPGMLVFYAQNRAAATATITEGGTIMENQKLDPAASQPYPWYDDRVETVRTDDTVRKGETVQRGRSSSIPPVPSSSIIALPNAPKSM